MNRLEEARSGHVTATGWRGCIAIDHIDVIAVLKHRLDHNDLRELHEHAGAV
jgi:hypothetical protein